ncbi:MFS transporter [Lacticaseibacillus pantheris]|jgi:MFS family permease|uniref:MFS transporter n=1 Tax=Lacticaseibacillus pantheris TaxID=171523 RepID=UPI0026582EDA|nr:MFS transporter [Lacticaseibacillus pantheris]WKF85964.1 MFS transporter [Lacticaseibacillus pantheris]
MIKQRNIISAYVYTFVSWFGITNLWVIYLGQQGLSLVQIGLCESIFHVASFLFEVPSGVLADRFSYKTVLFASRITTIASAVLMLVGQSWWWFAVSFVVSAWSYNLQSGTLEALVYESLAPATREAQYARATSMMGSLSEIAATAGVIVAGIFVHWHFSWVYRIQILLALVGLLCVASLRTPAGRSATGKDAAPRQTVITIVRAAGHVLRTQPALRNLMVLDASLSAVATAYYYYFQNVMTTHHWSSPMISGLMLTGSLLAVVGMQLLPWIQRRIGRFALLLGMTLLMVVALLGAGVHIVPVMVALYLVGQTVDAVIYPLFNTYYNAMIPDGQRATLLSVASMLFSVVMVVLFPVVGWGISRWGFNATFAGLGVVMSVIVAVWAVGQRRGGR